MSEQFKIIQRRAHPRGDAPFSLEAFCTVERALVSPEGGGFIGAMDKALAALGRSPCGLFTVQFPSGPGACSGD